MNASVSPKNVCVSPPSSIPLFLKTTALSNAHPPPTLHTYPTPSLPHTAHTTDTHTRIESKTDPSNKTF